MAAPMDGTRTRRGQCSRDWQYKHKATKDEMPDIKGNAETADTKVDVD